MRSPIVGRCSLVPPFLNRGTTTLVCDSRVTVPKRHTMLQIRVNQGSPTTSRSSGWVSSLTPRSFLSTSVTWVLAESPTSASSVEGILSTIQQYPLLRSVSVPPPIGLLWLDVTSYFLCPLLGSGFAAMTRTRPFLHSSKLPHQQLRQRTGPLRHNVLSFSRNLRALTTVGVEDLLDRGLGQMFPTKPHNTFGSVQPSPPEPNSVDSSALLLTQVSEKYGWRSDETTTKCIIDLLSKVS